MQFDQCGHFNYTSLVNGSQVVENSSKIKSELPVLYDSSLNLIIIFLVLPKGRDYFT
jgi:hypothetical protein